MKNPVYTLILALLAAVTLSACHEGYDSLHRKQILWLKTDRESYVYAVRSGEITVDGQCAKKKHKKFRKAKKAVVTEDSAPVKAKEEKKKEAPKKEEKKEDKKK